MFIFVVIIALLFSFANSISFFSGLFHQKSGEVYLGTIHYYEDYFFYLSHFFQGAHGAWLTANRYTSELTEPSFLFWPNILFGKIGGLLGLTPIFSYNAAVFLLSFFILIVMYQIFRRVFSLSPGRSALALIFAATGTSIMNHILVNGRPMWYPFELWKTPDFAFDRLGGVPHQLVQTLLFLLLTFFWFSKNKNRPVVSLFLVILLTSLNPVMSALFLGAALVTSRNKTQLLMLVVSLVGFFVTFFFYNTTINTQPHIQSKLWEVTQQIYTTPLFLLLSIGPLSVLAILGLIPTIKRRRPVDVFVVILLVICYGLVFTPIPVKAGISSSRILFPALYVFWGALALEGIQYASKRVPPLRLILIAIFFLLTIPTLNWEISEKLLVKPEERMPLLYLPTDVYGGFQKLAALGTYDDVVLANPLSHMDTMVPAFSGHTGFTGHPFATIQSTQKREIATRLFLRQMNATQAQQFLVNNRIAYVFFSQFDGDTTQFQNAYPFLKEVYQTPGVTIFLTKP